MVHLLTKQVSQADRARRSRRAAFPIRSARSQWAGAAQQAVRREWTVLDGLRKPMTRPDVRRSHRLLSVTTIGWLERRVFRRLVERAALKMWRWLPDVLA